METWANLTGEYSHYKVSSCGNVASVERVVIYENKFRKIVKSVIRGQVLKPYLCEGYLKVDLYQKSIRKKCFVHRLVAELFIHNPLRLPEVNHLNGDRTDNNITNLEWCTTSENNIHSFRCLGRRPTIICGENSSLSKGVLQIDNSGKIISEYFSATEAAKSNGFTRSRISECCQGKHKTAYGFIWKYKTDAHA